MSQMTLDEFEDLLDKAYQLKLEAQKFDDDRKEKEKDLSELSKVILAEFERLDKTSYVGRRCNVVRVQRPSVTLPKEPKDREAFFQYLKDKKIFEDLVTVNHATLNAYFKQELEAAIEEGRHDFEIPGIGQPKINEFVTFRKK